MVIFFYVDIIIYFLFCRCELTLPGTQSTYTSYYPVVIQTIVEEKMEHPYTTKCECGVVECGSEGCSDMIASCLLDDHLSVCKGAVRKCPACGEGRMTGML